MASKNENFFALLGDEDEEDPVAAALAAKKASKSTPKKEQPPPQQQQQHTAKLPSKPLPPAEAVRAERETQGERGRGGRRGRGRESFVSGGENSGDRDRDRHHDSAGASSDRGGRGGRGGGGRGARGGFNRADHDGYGDKSFEGGGRGRGRGRRFYSDEKRGVAPAEAAAAVPANQEEAVPPPEAESVAIPDSEKIPEPKKEEDPEEKEMTLDEYEKLVQEKRRSLGGQQRVEERKVEADSELKAMQLVDKKSDDAVFIKLGSDKEKLKRKDSAEKDEKAKKVININEFLKPTEGDRYSPRGGGGARGRGRSTGAPRYATSGREDDNGALSPSIDSPHDFPELGKKM